MIVTVGLNPAIDRILVVPGFRVGATLKAESVQSLASGKGANVAAVLKLLEQPVTYIGFVGIAEEELFRARLEGITCHLVEVDGQTRTDTTIIDAESGSETHIREPGFDVSAANMAALLEVLDGALRGATTAVFSGSLPPGAPVETYSELIALCKASGVRTVLDSSGEALVRGAAAQPTYLKPNAEELTELTGASIGSLAEAICLARTLLRGDTQGIAVSFGDQGAIFVNQDEAWQGVADAPSVVNTVGCGDAFVAGFLAAESKGLPAREQLHEALAVSAANAMSHGAGVIRQQDIQFMRTRVAISEMW